MYSFFNPSTMDVTDADDMDCDTTQTILLLVLYPNHTSSTKL